MVLAGAWRRLGLRVRWWQTSAASTWARRCAGRRTRQAWRLWDGRHRGDRRDGGSPHCARARHASRRHRRCEARARSSSRRRMTTPPPSCASRRALATTSARTASPSTSSPSTRSVSTRRCPASRWPTTTTTRGTTRRGALPDAPAAANRRSGGCAREWAERGDGMPGALGLLVENRKRLRRQRCRRWPRGCAGGARWAVVRVLRLLG